MSPNKLVKDHRGLRRRPLYSPILLVVLGVVAGGLLLGWIASGWGTTTVILVRHAETLQGDDPGLSPEGRVRAQRLAEMLSPTGLDAVFVSEARRSRETGAPAARVAGLSATEVPARDVQRMAETLKSNHHGEVVLVVGHSNTLPALAERLGVDVGDIAEDDYGGLWVISYSRLRGARDLALRY
ncbi:MAG: phosphoglycerate mutase family protein [Gammaproteobacteria bacterium]